MSTGEGLTITTTDDGCCKVCLTEDGFTECCTVSSMHLTQEKEKQLRAAIQKKAMNAMFE